MISNQTNIIKLEANVMKITKTNNVKQCNKVNVELKMTTSIKKNFDIILILAER